MPSGLAAGSGCMLKRSRCSRRDALGGQTHRGARPHPNSQWVTCLNNQIGAVEVTATSELDRYLPPCGSGAREQR